MTQIELDALHTIVRCLPIIAEALEKISNQATPKSN